MAKRSTDHQILSWDNNPRHHAIPPLFVGKRLASGVKVQKGMMLMYLANSATVRVDDVQEYPREDGKLKHYKKLLLTVIHKNGEEGKQFEAATVNAYLAVKTADLKEEHQCLFYDGQNIKGVIKDGILHPDKEFLIDWSQRVKDMLKLKNKYSYSRKHRADQQMPSLFHSIVNEIGTPVFNQFVRDYFVGQKDFDEACAVAHKAMRQIGPIAMHHPNKSFAEHMLYICVGMSEDLWSAIRHAIEDEA
jgi:hypothetical protein